MAESYAPGFLLAQSRPSNTTATTLYTAGMKTEVTRIIIANTTGSAATFRLFHDDDDGGTTMDETTALIWDNSIATANYVDIQAYLDGAGITIAAGGSLGIRSGTGNALTFSAYGIVSGVR